MLPAGKPDGSIDKHLASQNKREIWAFDHPIKGMVVMPIADLMSLLTLKEGWRAWALALEIAGRWR